MYEIAVSVGGELLAAWLITLFLAAFVGWALRDDVYPRPRRKKNNSKTEI